MCIEDLPVDYRTENSPTNNLPKQSLSNWFAVRSEEAAREVISFETAKALGVLPLSLSQDEFGEKLLRVAVPEAELQSKTVSVRMLTNCHVQAEAVKAEALEAAIELAYARGLNRLRALLKQEELNSSEGISVYVTELLRYAAAHNASDIHLQYSSRSCEVAIRVDGELRRLALEIPCEKMKQMLRKIKVSANMRPYEDQSVQDGAFSIPFGKKLIRLRVASLPLFEGERMALRLFVDTAEGADVRSLSSSAYPEWLRELLRWLTGHIDGAILFTGATGSGKSTLMCACVRELSEEGKRSICSLEDPVEQLLEGVSQVEIPRGEQYSPYLKALLRQDPDVIMMGEVRDPQTASTAFNAALSGHLLLTTVHGGSVEDALLRLQELGVSAAQLQGAVRAIISLQLVPANCESCLQPVLLNRPVQTKERPSYGKVGMGCRRCQGTGLRGRVLVPEVLVVTAELRQQTLRASLEGLPGYRSKTKSVRELLIAGRISPQIAEKLFGFQGVVASKKRALAEC